MEYLSAKARAGEVLTEKERVELKEYLEPLNRVADEIPSGTEMLGEEKVGLKKPDKP
jgi:hypothetical protein